MVIDVRSADASQRPSGETARTEAPTPVFQISDQVPVSRMRSCWEEEPAPVNSIRPSAEKATASVRSVRPAAVSYTHLTLPTTPYV